MKERNRILLLSGEDHDLTVTQENEQYLIGVSGYYFGTDQNISKELYDLLIKELSREEVNDG